MSKGDIVKRGDVIGKAGNMGYSERTHLHYHVQNTEIFEGQYFKWFNGTLPIGFAEFDFQNFTKENNYLQYSSNGQNGSISAKGIWNLWLEQSGQIYNENCEHFIYSAFQICDQLESTEPYTNKCINDKFLAVCGHQDFTAISSYALMCSGGCQRSGIFGIHDICIGPNDRHIACGHKMNNSEPTSEPTIQEPKIVEQNPEVVKPKVSENKLVNSSDPRCAEFSDQMKNTARAGFCAEFSSQKKCYKAIDPVFFGGAKPRFETSDSWLVNCVDNTYDICDNCSEGFMVGADSCSNVLVQCAF